MTPIKGSGGPPRIVQYLIGGSFFRRFVVYFCFALTVMLVGMRHQLMAWSAGEYHFWAWGPALVVVVMFAVVVSVAFASIRAVTDVMLRRLAAAGISRLPRKKDPQ